MTRGRSSGQGSYHTSVSSKVAIEAQVVTCTNLSVSLTRSRFDFRPVMVDIRSESRHVAR